ncbi:hypothetical protein [Halobellus ordinarius]|uniref:hypothetical protein n=1 Tax=Halobellus ordinarius TaxID=3075120 RepID=UPI0028804AB1|nr:hypothetical protein [Halobellus sp. ZY16]
MPPSSVNRKTLFAVTVVAHLLLTAWVRRDARKRDIDPSPWDALTLLTGIAGVVGYRRRR